MAGAIRRMLDQIVKERSKGNAIIATSTVTKLIVKGLDPARFSATSPDDPATLEKVRSVAREMNVALS